VLADVELLEDEALDAAVLDAVDVLIELEVVELAVVVLGIEDVVLLVAVLLVVEEVLLVTRLGLPITRDADSPLENGGVNSRTLLLPWSATQRSPLESNDGLAGVFRPLAVAAAPPVVKLCWPITIDADSPVEKGGVYSRTLS